MMRRFAENAFVAGGIVVGVTIVVTLTAIGWALSKWEERR